MADLNLPFNMETAESKFSRGDANEGHKRLMSVMTVIYDEAPYVFTVLEDSQMRVYACERFDEWFITHEGDSWAALTSAVQDTLQKYPLRSR